MVDETELEIIDADDRPTHEECDECGKKSNLYHKEEIDDEMLEDLERDGWRYSEGVLFCDECAVTCHNNT